MGRSASADILNLRASVNILCMRKKTHDIQHIIGKSFNIDVTNESEDQTHDISIVQAPYM